MYILKINDINNLLNITTEIEQLIFICGAGYPITWVGISCSSNEPEPYRSNNTITQGLIVAENSEEIAAVTIPASDAGVVSTLTEAEKHFVQEVAGLLASRGLSPSAGRVYGYLLLKTGPVSVDQIAMDLELSRVGAWNAARSLETYGHVRRYGSPGSKRALYSASPDFGLPLLKQAALLGQMGDVLLNCARDIAEENVAAELQERAEFYGELRQTMEQKIAELNARRARRLAASE